MKRLLVFIVLLSASASIANTGVIRNRATLAKEAMRSDISDSVGVARTEMRNAISDSIGAVKAEIQSDISDSIGTAKTELQNAVSDSIGTAKTEMLSTTRIEIADSINQASRIDSVQIKDGGIIGSDLRSDFEYNGAISFSNTTSDSQFVTHPVKWALSLSDFILVGSDSAGSFTTYTTGIDTTIALTRNRVYLDFTKDASPTERIITLGQIITNYPILNPDSLLYDFSATAGEDSIKFRIRIKNGGTTNINTGWIAANSIDIWEHGAYWVLPEFEFALNQEYEIYVDVRGKSGARIKIAAIEFK